MSQGKLSSFACVAEIMQISRDHAVALAQKTLLLVQIMW